MPSSYFSDETFQDHLLALLVKDRKFLKQCFPLLSDKDFKQKNQEGQKGTSRWRWIISKIALKYFEQYGEPVKDLLQYELKNYCHRNNIEGKLRNSILEYAEKLIKKKVIAVDSITDNLIAFKKEQLKKAAVEELFDLQSKGELSDERWLEICNEAIQNFGTDTLKAINLFSKAEIKKRINRRRFRVVERFPVLFIDDLDAQIRAVARGHLGLILAPFKRGKSLFLIWLAIAYSIQGLNVLYITLEDPQEDVEDRFDACVTKLPIKNIGQRPRLFRKRMKLFTRFLRSKIKVIDGTDTDVTVPLIQTIYDRERDSGFLADVVIIDYDEEMKAVKNYRENRRLEFDEIYRALRKFMAKNKVIGWTAAQTKRGTQNNKILSADDVAEDISKIKKSALVLTLGQGDWTEDSIYVHVAAHKYDRKFVGCTIIPNLEKMVFYDREATIREKKKHIQQEEEEEVT